MGLNAEWFDTPADPVVVEHDGAIRVGEFGEAMTPDIAEELARALQHAAAIGRRLKTERL